MLQPSWWYFSSGSLCSSHFFFAKQEWRRGDSTRLPPMWPVLESWRRHHMWVEFADGSLPCSWRFFSGYSGFNFSLKTNTSKFQFDLEHTDMFQRVLMNSKVLRAQTNNNYKNYNVRIASSLCFKARLSAKPLIRFFLFCKLNSFSQERFCT